MNKPKYQIGDVLRLGSANRIPNSNVYVRGIAILSNGQARYFLQIFDNTLVLDAEQLEHLDYHSKLIKPA